MMIFHLLTYHLHANNYHIHATINHNLQANLDKYKGHKGILWKHLAFHVVKKLFLTQTYYLVVVLKM
jgi:hypothetical protein